MKLYPMELGMSIPRWFPFLGESRNRGMAILHSSGIEEDEIYSSGSTHKKTGQLLQKELNLIVFLLTNNNRSIGQKLERQKKQPHKKLPIIKLSPSKPQKFLLYWKFLYLTKHINAGQLIKKHIFPNEKLFRKLLIQHMIWDWLTFNSEGT